MFFEYFFKFLTIYYIIALNLQCFQMKVLLQYKELNISFRGCIQYHFINRSLKYRFCKCITITYFILLLFIIEIVDQ